MNKYNVHCKGPFPDGRGGECWVRVGELELPENADPRKQLSKYMCCVCGVAEQILRPLCQENRIPWWDPDYRASVIASLELPAQVYPFLPQHEDQARNDMVRHQMEDAVTTALWNLLWQKLPDRERFTREFRNRARPAIIPVGERILVQV